MTHYQNRGGEIWELCKDGQWRELFTDAAICRLTYLESLAESNGKLAHDLGIQLAQSKEANAGLMKACKHLESEPETTRSRQTRVCLFCGMESVTYVR
jgi:hypothetical protein